MIIADESETNNNFTAERVRFSCRVENIGNEDHEDIFKLFKQENNPNIIDKLRDLDFSLFELTPQEGRYVVGFGLAFNLSIDGIIFNHVVVDKNNKDK